MKMVLLFLKYYPCYRILFFLPCIVIQATSLRIISVLRRMNTMVMLISTAR